MIPYPQIDPIAFSIGPIKVHWYGLMYLFGIGAGWWLAARRSRLSWAPVNREMVDDLVFYVALGVVLGGRLGYVFFYGLDRFVENPLWLFYVWDGGMSFHGGLIGVIVAMLLFGRKYRTNPFDLLDFIAPFVPIGLGLGRIGNFLNGELWGRPTDLPWAMIFPNDPARLPRHPSQLYQFALEGVALFLILFIYSRRPRPRFAVSGLFLLCYGCFRFAVEFVREPDPQLGFVLFGWLTRGQELSVPMIVGGIWLLWLAHRRGRLIGGGGR